MVDTWMDLLTNMGVFGQVEMCRDCKRKEGTHQMWFMNHNGDLVPSHKLCDTCHADFKAPSKWLERRRKRHDKIGGC